MDILDRLALDYGQHPVEIVDPLEELAIIERDVHKMAAKAGVPGEDYEHARAMFARELVPHAGRAVKVEKLSRYRKWWRGYAAGLRAARST